MARVREMGKVAQDCSVDYCLEVLNRFEGYLLNTAEVAVQYVREVDCTAVKVMLDTFHMNIEEDSIGDVIRTAGSVKFERYIARKPIRPIGRFAGRDSGRQYIKGEMDT